MAEILLIFIIVCILTGGSIYFPPLGIIIGYLVAIFGTLFLVGWAAENEQYWIIIILLSLGPIGYGYKYRHKL